MEHKTDVVTKRFLYFVVAASVVLLGIAGALWGIERVDTEQPPVFSEREMLEGLWHNYKQDFLEEGTLRALDPERGNITTSEGQSYTMLRAVWMDDQETFDQAWQWTKDNLQREDDYLLSWLFGERSDGTYGVLDVPGAENSASDGDTDIALALLLAYSRWRQDAYYYDATALIEDIWEHEVVEIGGRWYMAANNIEKTAATNRVLLNPSYFAPYAYRIFAVVDTEHPWSELVGTTYDVIERSMTALESENNAVLPPDWVAIDRRTGEISAPRGDRLTTDYSFDAVRIPWRIAMDWAWFREPRARETLQRLSFLEEEWRQNGRLSATYTNTGEAIIAEESPVMYGTSIGYFMLLSPANARDIYRAKLANLYSPDTFDWQEPLSYYASNWAWFGIALYSGFAENYTASK